MKDLLTNLVYNLLLVIIPVLAIFIGNAIKYGTNLMQTKNKKETGEIINKYIDIANKIVIDVVDYVAQTFVDSLKKEGKFDLDAQRAAYEEAENRILELLTPELKKVIDSIYGDVDIWLSTQIEAEVKRRKTNPKKDIAH